MRLFRLHDEGSRRPTGRSASAHQTDCVGLDRLLPPNSQPVFELSEFVYCRASVRYASHYMAGAAVFKVDALRKIALKIHHFAVPFEVQT